MMRAARCACTRLPATVAVSSVGPDHVWDATDHFGASLHAYCDMLGDHGYSFAGGLPTSPRTLEVLERA
jgi:hypothetical protein